MLPPGHVAGGYLTAYALIKIAKPDLDDAQIQQLLALGALFGFSPDLDMFAAFAKIKSWTIQSDKIDHRKFISHAPFVWLVAGLLIYFLSDSTFIQYVGLLVWLGGWSHFVLDSFGHGIRWFWPFSKRLFALKDVDVKSNIAAPGFFNYWSTFLKHYTTQLSFYLEIVVIISAITTFITSNN